MKRSLLLIFLCNASFAIAQNSFPPSGNVGIGTSSPKALLDVNGTAYFKSVGFGASVGIGPVLSERRWFTQPREYNYSEFHETSHGGAASFLFNAYPSVLGTLTAAGNVKYATDAGAYSSGAGMISYTGNGGYFSFYSSPASTGSGTDVQWLPLLRLYRTQAVSLFGPLDITAANPEIKLVSNNTTLPRSVIRGNGGFWLIGYQGVAGSEETIIGNRAGADNRSLALTAGGKNQIAIAANGNMDIGNTATAASAKIGIYGTVNLNNGSLNLNSNQVVLQAGDGFRMKYNNDFFNTSEDAVVFEKTDGNGETPDGGIAFVNSGSTGISTTSMVIRGTGNVGIGTIAPDAKLVVNGQVKAASVKVTGSVNLPDYVFDHGYALNSLDYVETFIKTNKHLPEVPSAKTVAQEGMDLGEMNAVLLKKIEELTLYLIELKKSNEKQQLEIDELKSRLK